MSSQPRRSPRLAERANRESSSEEEGDARAAAGARAPGEGRQEGERRDSDMEEDEDDMDYVLGEDSDSSGQEEAGNSTVLYIDSLRRQLLPTNLAGMLQSSLGRLRRRPEAEEQYPPLPATWPEVQTGLRREVEQNTSPVIKRTPFKEGPGREGPSAVGTRALLRGRECGQLGGSRPGLSQAQQRHLCCSHFLPQAPSRPVDRMASRAYIGQFSHQGDLFFAAFQHERRIKIYETEREWRVRKNVHARNLRWTVTDTALSPDGRLLLYSSITPIANCVNVASGGVESEANVTDIHDELPFNLMVGEFEAGGRGFGIWSLAWAPNGQEVLAGTGRNSWDIFSLEAKRCTSSLEGHQDDVNAVAFLSSTSSDVVVSGSDDCTLKVWDRRVSRTSHRGMPRPDQELPGHVGGMTHIDAKGDGHHLISTSKDQSTKLWDIRMARRTGGARGFSLPFRGFDYRWMDWPATGRLVSHPADCSLQTYRGHNVLQTLVRAYFSPMHTTGQRYIYAGSADGTVRIWDLVSGVIAAELPYHREMVRDVSWHPTTVDQLATVSWDGSVMLWGAAGRGKAIPEPGHDLLEEYY